MQDNEIQRQVRRKRLSRMRKGRGKAALFALAAAAKLKPEHQYSCVPCREWDSVFCDGRAATCTADFNG
eukprot:743204-Pyramimonas_sp.AAC.1